MIAVHCGKFTIHLCWLQYYSIYILGAGYYSNKTMRDYKLLSKRACKKGMAVIESGGTALQAVNEAIIGNSLSQ